MNADAERALAILGAAAVEQPVSAHSSRDATLCFWRLSASAAAACAPAPAPPLHGDPLLYDPNPTPRAVSRAVPPPQEIMENEASSLVNCRIKVALLRNLVTPAQRLLLRGGLLARLAAEPVFWGVAEGVGLTSALLARALGAEPAAREAGQSEEHALSLQVRARPPPALRHPKAPYLNIQHAHTHAPALYTHSCTPPLKRARRSCSWRWQCAEGQPSAPRQTRLLPRPKGTRTC